jgi:hypothetical protein
VEVERYTRSNCSGGLDLKEARWELAPSDDESSADNDSGTYVRITVPAELDEPDTWEDVSNCTAGTIFGEELPRGSKIGLELASDTKFGLDGRPIGITLGLEDWSSELNSGKVVESDANSGGTRLTVERTTGNWMISSSTSLSLSFPWRPLCVEAEE